MTTLAPPSATVRDLTQHPRYRALRPVESLPEPPPDRRSSMERAIDGAIERMKEDLTCPGGIRELARSCNYSQFHFCREFRRRTGKTPVQYLADLRMAEAKHLLATTDMSVTEICMTIGYHSLGTFGTRFAEALKMPPTVYRRIHAGQVCPETA